MAKKRSCRRTADEDKIHEKAVKMRKMTDERKEFGDEKAWELIEKAEE